LTIKYIDHHNCEILEIYRNPRLEGNRILKNYNDSFKGGKKQF